ncbi:MAG TPA: metalloregulator ArsR/SmtB family transcription factor [Candidatus Angelobacter sp.]|nr:metalloregulator ArsR/SmtB family transcription factor [Candidatus Angelobacter sp.]
MNVSEHHDAAVSRIASAIGDPARSRMLYCLSDGHARTSTELAIVAGVSPSTASAHLSRLMAERLVKVHAQGKHRYYSLKGPNVAAVLERLSVLAGSPEIKFIPNTPDRLRFARTCYDHMAGTLGVLLHDRLHHLRWLATGEGGKEYEVTAEGAKGLSRFGIDLDAERRLRRRFACACLDWSERRPHLAGALGAALVEVALRKKWVVQELDCRALRVTALGRREMQSRFGLQI